MAQIFKSSQGCEIQNDEVHLESNANYGIDMTSTSGVQTAVGRGIINNSNQGNVYNTVTGDTADATSGNAALTAGSTTEIIGAPMFNDGNAAAANAAAERPLAMQAQSGDDKNKNFSIATSLTNIAQGIKNATTYGWLNAANTDGGLYEPTGELMRDLSTLIVYYQKQLTQFTLKGTIRRIALVIKNEVEKLAMQVEETVQRMKKIAASITSYKELKKLRTPPSTENKSGNRVMTGKDAATQVLGDKEASLIKTATKSAP